jgi:tRNA (cmo5U34)-methyltransferase
MLDRALERVTGATRGRVTVLQADIREAPLPEGAFDIVVAAACLHHLRAESEWHSVFAKVFRALRPGGSFWISDLVDHERPELAELMRERYGQYLAGLKDESYRDHVFAYIDREDTPRSLPFQLDLLRAVGFETTEVLHKNACFATFGAIRAKQA